MDEWGNNGLMVEGRMDGGRKDGWWKVGWMVEGRMDGGR